jgi:hypothetical protein
MANNQIEYSLEEAKTRINEIVFTMSEPELEKLQIGLEKWRRSNLGKRKNARKDLSLFATFWLGGHFFRDYIKNISAGGFFLKTNIPVYIGGTVTISFSLSENAGRIKAKGEIVRIDRDGFGGKFNQPLSTIT